MQKEDYGLDEEILTTQPEDLMEALQLDTGKKGVQGNTESEATDTIPELLSAMIAYLNCRCHYFAPMKDDDPIMNCFQEASRRGKTEGFTPILIPADETLWETLMINSNNDEQEDNYAFDKHNVMCYRNFMLTQPLKNHNEFFEPRIAELKENAEENKLNKEEHIIGEQKNEDENNRFLSYWNYSTEMTFPLILAEIPAAHPWEIFTWLPFGGWNDCPNTQDLMAITKSWHERFGAIPAVLTHDELEFHVPTSIHKQEAMQLALEQYAFCPDVIDQGPEGGSVELLANTLLESTIWYFWWD